MLSLVYGCLAIVLAFVCHNMGSLINVGSRLFGACMGPMFGLCLVSVLCPMVNLKGATSGVVLGQIINMWLSLGAMIEAPAPQALPLQATNCSIFNLTSNMVQNMASLTTTPVPVAVDESAIAADDNAPFFLYTLSYNIYPMIGTASTILLALLISACTGFNSDLDEEDSKHFYPPAWRMHCFLSGLLGAKFRRNNCNFANIPPEAVRGENDKTEELTPLRI